MWSIPYRYLDGSSDGIHKRFVLVVTVLLLASSIGAGVGTAALTPTDGERETSAVSGGATTPATAVDPGNDTGGSTTALTLITGDTVIVEDRGDETTYRVDSNASVSVRESRAGTYVLPQGVDRSTFSDRLFNVDLLRAQNQTDAEATTIPLIVEWANETSMRRGLRAEDLPGVSQDRVLDLLNGSAVEVSKENAAVVYDFLARSHAVESVGYNGRVEATAIDTRETVNAGIARAAFDVTGAGTTVAVLDSGVNESHPDIGEDEVGEANFVGGERGRDVANHGTPIAGIITGDGAASNGSLLGVAPDAEIRDVRVLDNQGRASEATVLDGFEYALEQDVDVISMSLGNFASTHRREDPYRQYVEAATRNGITVLAASGNTGPAYGSIQTPGIHRDVITVGASTNGSRIVTDSGRGPTRVGRFVKPDVVAPGERVTAPSGNSTGYKTDGGTSYATPFASGAVALLLERNPGWHPQRVKNVVTSTAKPTGRQDVYSQGSGNLDVAAALDPGIVLDPGVIDFGRVPVNDTIRRTVTVRNLEGETRHVNVSASATAIRSDTSGSVWTNRSALTLRPGEDTAVTLVVETPEEGGRAFSGRLAVGEASAGFGYDPTSLVTVEKRGLGSVDGDEVTLFNRDTNRTVGTKEFEGSPLRFEVDRPGDYVAISAGNDSGQPVVTVNSTTVDTAGRVVLDETETTTQRIDVESLPNASGQVDTRTVRVNATVSGHRVGVRAVADDPATNAVRVSPTDAATYTVRRILTDDPGSQAYDTSSIYHLQHRVADPRRSETVDVDGEDLQRQHVRYYRGSPGETYSSTLGAPDFDDGTLSDSFASGGIGTTFEQTIYVSPGLTQYHDAFGVGSAYPPDWVATSTSKNGYLSFDESGSMATAVRKHPFRSVVDLWSLSATQFEVRVFPHVGQPPNGYLVDSGGNKSYRLWVNGTRIRSASTDDETTSFTIRGTDFESVKLRVRARHDQSPLSHDTVTTFAATTGADSRPPSVPTIGFESHGMSNVIPNGSVDVTISTTDGESGVRNVSLYVATRDEGVPDTTPFANGTAWRRVAVNETSEGTYETTLDLGAYRGALSVALRADDSAGNYVETTATDAVVVGSRTPTAVLATNRTLVETGEAVRLDAGASYDDLAIAGYAWDLDGDGIVDDRTREPTITHRYVEAGAVEPTVTVRDSHGFENSTGRITVAAASDLPPRMSAIDTRTLADVKRAVESGRVRTAPARLDGEQTVGNSVLLLTRGAVNGGFDGEDGSTVAVDGGRVNGDTEAHNVIGANARFNGGIEADGTVTVTTGAVRASGGIDADESVYVRGNSTLSVSGELEAETVYVGDHGSLLVRGDVEAARIRTGTNSTVQVRGHIECDESRVGAGGTVDVRGHSDCDASGTAAGSPSNRVRHDGHAEPTNNADRISAPTPGGRASPPRDNGTSSTGNATETGQPTESEQMPNTTETTRTVPRTNRDGVETARPESNRSVGRVTDRNESTVAARDTAQGTANGETDQESNGKQALTEDDSGYHYGPTTDQQSPAERRERNT